jgi:DNA polymerase-3 subunit epsilon
VVRKLGPGGLAYLGPFRSKRMADEVVMAIWDAVPIRRCRSRSSGQTGKCAVAQIGVANCPCDGTLTRAEYAAVVASLLDGIRDRPQVLLDPLVERMTRLSVSERYEEAAWVRDRHQMLSRSLETRRVWQAMTGAGLLEMEAEDGSLVVVDHGLLVETRHPSQPPALLPSGDSGAAPPPEVPPSVECAEEVLLIWRWLERTQVRIVEATGSLCMPAHRVEPLNLPQPRAA